jgi:hypothetical protein
MMENDGGMEVVVSASNLASVDECEDILKPCFVSIAYAVPECAQSVGLVRFVDGAPFSVRFGHVLVQESEEDA